MKASETTIRNVAAAAVAAPQASRRHRRNIPRGAALIHSLLCVAALAVAAPAFAQSGGQEGFNREYQIKAAFLYNFGRDAYIRWPLEALGDESQPFVIGILGRNPFGNSLAEIAQHKKVKGRKFVVLRFPTMDDYQSCHVLFVGRNVTREQQLEAIQRTANDQVLVVGESLGFAASGGVINFYLEQNTVRFEINLESARQRGLVISSRLLGVARVLGHDRANDQP